MTYSKKVRYEGLKQEASGRPRLARWQLLVGIPVAALALAACGSSATKSSAAGDTSSAVAPTEASTATPTTAAATSPAPARTPAPTTATSPPAGASAPAATGVICAENQLKASVDTSTHLAGNGTEDAEGRTKHGVILLFQNTSPTTCTITGYPGAATVDSNQKQVTQATRTLRGPLGGLPASQAKFASVTIATGQYAQAVLEGVDQKQQGAAQAGCDTQLPRIFVTPPDTTIPVPFKVTWGACYSFTIHPVVPRA